LQGARGAAGVGFANWAGIERVCRIYLGFSGLVEPAAALMHVSPATRRSLVNFGERVGTANAYLIIALMVGAMIAELFLNIVRAYCWAASD
jgi:hypothetical protein